MLSPALPPAVLSRVVGMGESIVEGQMEPARAGGGGASSSSSSSSSSRSSNSSSDSSSPTVTLVGFKKLPNFSEEFLGSMGQGVKRIKYLEIPHTERMRHAPPAIVVQHGGRAGSSMGGGGGITDTSRRKEKLKSYENECSWAIDHVYFGGEAVARNLAILESKGITHVVNCVKLDLDNYFPQKLNYLGLYLEDSGREDMLCVLYDAFDFIESAARQNGKVFVHCQQGVSRSAALVIAYAMWRTGMPFDVVKDTMKERRGVVDPNANFSLQLMYWEKRPKDPLDCVIYRITPQSRYKPAYLVPKLCLSPRSLGGGITRTDALDPRGAFVLKLRKKAILWVGEACPNQFVSGGRRFLAQLLKYEQIEFLQEIRQGGETADMKKAMGLDTCTTQNQFIAERDAFSQDFTNFLNALTPRTSVTEGIRPAGQLGSTPPRPPIPAYRRSQSEPRPE